MPEPSHLPAYINNSNKHRTNTETSSVDEILQHIFQKQFNMVSYSVSATSRLFFSEAVGWFVWGGFGFGCFVFFFNFPALRYTWDRIQILQNNFQVHLCYFFAQVFGTYRKSACTKEQVYENCACMKGDSIY